MREIVFGTEKQAGKRSDGKVVVTRGHYEIVAGICRMIDSGKMVVNTGATDPRKHKLNVCLIILHWPMMETEAMVDHYCNERLTMNFEKVVQQEMKFDE